MTERYIFIIVNCNVPILERIRDAVWTRATAFLYV